MIWVMAWRNVLRHARRSLLTMAAVALGLSALLFLWGFNDGVHNSMMRNLQETIVGSVQIHARGAFRHPKLSRTVPDAAGVARLLRKLGVTRYSFRLHTFALAAGEHGSEGVVLLGMDPAREARVTRLHRKVGQGCFLRADDGRACVLGATTARNLGVHVGDEVVFLAQDRYGALAADRFRLVGVIDSGEMGIDRGLAVVPLATLDAMLDMRGAVSGVVMQLPRARLEAVTARLRASLDDRYEVLRWYDMYPMMKQWVDLENGFYYIFLTIVLVIVAAGVMNTVLMSTLERVHEFGIMSALGCGRWRLALMVAAESVTLGAAGCLAGAGLGLGLVALFHRVGIDLSSRMDTVTRFYINPVIHTEIDTGHLWATILAVLACSLAAAVVPAWRAARLTPVEALRHV